MSKKNDRFDPLTDVLRPGRPDESPERDKVHVPAEPDDISEPIPQAEEDYFRYLGTLLLLFRAPRKGIAELFAPPWPRYVITLTLALFVIPFGVHYLIPSTARYEGIYLALNQLQSISEDDFRRTVFYTSAFGLFAVVIIGAVVQKLIFRLHGLEFSLLDSYAVLCYSSVPLLVADVLLSVGDTTIASVNAFRILVIVVANLWSLVVWYSAIQVLTKLSFRRIFTLGVLGFLLPLLLLLTVLFVLLLLQFNWQGDEPPNLERIYDSLRLRERQN